MTTKCQFILGTERDCLHLVHTRIGTHRDACLDIAPLRVPERRPGIRLDDVALRVNGGAPIELKLVFDDDSPEQADCSFEARNFELSIFAKSGYTNLGRGDEAIVKYSLISPVEPEANLSR